ncbi:MAG TPA: CPBP family intramembrane glutamic endopeptidase [Candidatus Acidoferrum sp.]
MTNRKGIGAYLLITFGTSWTLWEGLFRLGVSVNSPFFQLAILPGAFAPALAAFIVRKWITCEGFADAGLRLNFRKWPYYVVAWVLPVVAVGCIVISAVLLRIGAPDFSLVRGLKYLTASVGPMPAPVPPHPWLVVAGFSLPVNAILATPILFGEEFGWRGYLQLRLFPDRPVASAIVTGVIWGVWHYPLLLRGYDFPQSRLAALIVFPVTTVFLSIIFAWLLLKTDSIWSASFAHAATNAIGGSLSLLLFGGGASLLFVLYLGILGWIPLGMFSFWITLTGQLKPTNAAIA